MLIPVFAARSRFAFCLTMASRVTSNLSLSLTPSAYRMGGDAPGVGSCYVFVIPNNTVFFVRYSKGFMVTAKDHLVETGLFGGKGRSRFSIS